MQSRLLKTCTPDCSLQMPARRVAARLLLIWDSTGQLVDSSHLSDVYHACLRETLAGFAGQPLVSMEYRHLMPVLLYRLNRCSGPDINFLKVCFLSLTHILQ